MPKKNKNKNKNTWIVVGVVVGVFALYFASSYAGLLSTKTFSGNDAIATMLECSLSDKNELAAVLTVSGAGFHSAALSSGSPLQAQNVQWNVAQSSGSITPSISVTNEDGVAKSKFEQLKGADAYPIVATYAGDKIRIDARENTNDAKITTTIVEYGPSSCEVTSSAH